MQALVWSQNLLGLYRAIGVNMFRCLHGRMQKMSSSIEAQAFDFFLVLDFEATCEENKKLVPQVP